MRSIIAGALFFVAAAAVGIYLYAKSPRAIRGDLLYHKVIREPLSLTVMERGALESADNRDVICRVRAGNKASTLSIKWVIEDGTIVKQGQPLVEIEDTPLQDQLKTQRIALDTARASMVQAEQNQKITQSQNYSDISTAKVAVELAEIDLRKYLEGDYLKEKMTCESAIKLAQSDCDLQRDRVGYTQRMVKMKYLGATQLQAELAKLRSLEVALDKAQEEQRVLENFTKGRNIKDLSNKVDEAKRTLDRTEKQAEAKAAQAESDFMTRKSIFEQEQDKFDDIEEQIANCHIVSPQDGLVVYFVSEQSRFGSGSSQSIIAQGEPVKEGQRLMRIPDLRRMLVNTKVHEAMVSRIQGEVWRRTGFSEGVRSGLMFNVDPMTRTLAQYAMFDLKEAFRDLDHEKLQDGQKAKIRIDAFPDRILDGHVKSVATVASQQDWMSADVKVYQTLVSIDESLDGLKPGMSAEVTVQIDEVVENTLALPMQAIFGGVELGMKRKCFVKSPNGPVETEITIGLANEKMAEVKSGLKEGDEVVINPKAILGDRIRVRTPAEQERSDSLPAEGKKNRGQKNAKKAGNGLLPPSAKSAMPGKSA